jgi:hypothetical protein
MFENGQRQYKINNLNIDNEFVIYMYKYCE